LREPNTPPNEYKTSPVSVIPFNPSPSLNIIHSMNRFPTIYRLSPPTIGDYIYVM